MEKLYRTSTTDLKALYDFSMIHCDRMKNVGKINEANEAENNRTIIYNELLKRFNNESIHLSINE